MPLGTADLVVIGLYLVVITGCGVWLSRFQTDSRAYFLGNRNIPWPAVCLSVVATETSVLTFIGVPALSYGSNMCFLQLSFGYLAARIILAWFFLPAYLQQDTYTVYGYLDRRFGPLARNLASALFFITQALGSGVRLYAAALVLTTVAGTEATIWAIVAMAAVTVGYTLLGGIAAVIWTDVVQATIMIGGGVLALWILAGMFGDPGVFEVLAAAAAAGKLRVFDFSFDLGRTYTFWSGIVGGTFLGMASHGTDQVLAQRLLTCRSLSDGRKAIIGSGLVIIPQFLLFLVVGVLLHSYYGIHPPAEAIGNPDRIFPHFIVNHFPPVAAGLVVAAMLGAAMSTLDSAIQALSSSTVMDVIRPLNGKAPVWIAMDSQFTLLAVKQMLPQISQVAGFETLAARLLSASLQLQLSDGLRGSAAVRCQTANDALVVSKLLQAAVTFQASRLNESQPDLARVLGNLRLNQPEDRVELALAISQSELNTLIQNNSLALKF